MKNSEQKFVFNSVSEMLGKTEHVKNDFEERCKLAATLGKFIRESALTQSQIAEILEVDQPRVSDLARGKISKFSLGTLIEFLWKLKFDVEIKVKEPEAVSLAFKRTKPLRTKKKTEDSETKNLELACA